MDGFIMVVVLSITMFVGSFISGIIPLTLSLSENKKRLMTIFGAGLLVSTALAVIIPEGVHTLYANDNSQLTTQQHHHEQQAMTEVKIDDPHVRHPPGHHVHKRETTEELNKIFDSMIKRKRDALHDKMVQDKGPQDDNLNLKDEHEDAHKSGSHSSIGVTLVLGFVLMFIVDQIGGNMVHVQSSDLQSIRNRVTFTTTLGLVIHAGVDGLALGAAASSTQSDVKMIVFIAIMLHKAPASFGLVSFLLHQGLDRIRVKRHLAIFALAAPVGAIFTYIILNLPNQQSFVTSNSTGICMLFSAGTFLYVSTVHVLPEVQNHDTKLSLTEVIAFIVGSILPLVLSIGHSH